MSEIDFRWLAVAVLVVAGLVIAALLVGVTEPGHVLGTTTV